MERVQPIFFRFQRRYVAAIDTNPPRKTTISIQYVSAERLSSCKLITLLKARIAKKFIATEAALISHSTMQIIASATGLLFIISIFYFWTDNTSVRRISGCPL